MRRFLLVALAALGLSVALAQSADAAVVARGSSAAGRPAELDVTGQTATVTFVNPATGARLTANVFLVVTNLETGLVQTYESQNFARLQPGTYRIQAGLRTVVYFRPFLDTVTFDRVEIS